MTSIFKKIEEEIKNISEEDLDNWVVPGVVSHYNDRLNKLSKVAYGVDNSSVAKAAFKERAKMEIRSALETFIFKAEHWKAERNMNSYLLTTLNRLAKRIRWDKENVKHTNAPVCPGCKHNNSREYLGVEDGKLRCVICTKMLEVCADEIKNNDNQQKLLRIENKLRLYRAFASHSKKGYRCLDCSRFIPESCNTSYGIACPYPDCFYCGDVNDMQKMLHPSGISQRTHLSLDYSTESDGPDIYNVIPSGDIDPGTRLEAQELFEKEYDVLAEVMSDQIDSIKRTSPKGTLLQKLVMYEAYQNMLETTPDDMVSYLVHLKQSSDFPIQARIFQEYARLMQESLPTSIFAHNKKIDVYSLTDPRISLFTGISTFDARVSKDNKIPNNTKETYTGGRLFKDYGPCFIGLIIDVIDKETNKSIKSSVKEYSFVQIKMEDNILPGTAVEVKHYRIPSHYEMGALVYLQRTRRKIVDKVYYRMNGTKREIGKK